MQNSLATPQPHHYDHRDATTSNTKNQLLKNTTFGFSSKDASRPSTSSRISSLQAHNPKPSKGLLQLTPVPEHTGQAPSVQFKSPSFATLISVPI